MSENGTEKRSTIWQDVTDQICDHFDLAALELRYETDRVFKRLVLAAACLTLILTGFIVLQVALIGALMQLGWSLGLAAFVLSALYFLLAGVIYVKAARRDPRVGPAFAATQKEMRETLQWIQKIFS